MTIEGNQDEVRELTDREFQDAVEEGIDAATQDVLSRIKSGQYRDQGVKDVIAHLTPQQERRDMLSYLEETRRRMPKFARRAAAIPAGEPWSAEWFEQVGSWWKSRREARGWIGSTGTYLAAAKARLHVNTVRLLENGLAEPEELRGDEIKGYAETLEPGLYERFSETFGLNPK